MQISPLMSSAGSSRSPLSIMLLLPACPTRQRPAELSPHQHSAGPGWSWDHRALQEHTDRYTWAASFNFYTLPEQANSSLCRSVSGEQRLT